MAVMHSAMRRFGLAATILLAPVMSGAQQAAAGDTKAEIAKAIDMYNAFNIEGARAILANIISPSYLLKVEPAERVLALKYLGASYAVLDKQDSAVTFFMAAVDFDPFTSLSTDEFSAAEQNAFARAKQQLFKVAIRDIAPRILDTTYTFQLVTSHRSAITVTLVEQRDTTKKEILFQGDNDGQREVAWRGLLRSGDRADSTTYEVRVEGRSSLASMGGQTTAARQLFRIEHVFEPLEDTLPSIPRDSLLPAEYRPSSPWRDLAKGTLLGVFAAGLPFAILDTNVKYRPHAIAAGGIGIGSAAIAFFYRRANRTIPANVRENQRRQAQRAAFNAGVTRRNADRKSAMVLLICPPTGCPR